MAKSAQKFIFAIFILVILSSVIWISIWLKSNSKSQSLLKYTKLTEFSLVDQDGESFSLDNLYGKIWIADFIFTRCQGPCPIMSSHMQRLQTSLSHSPSVGLLSFSVDPTYDTPEVLTKYANTFGAQKDKWYFITGDRDAIYDLARSNLKMSVEDKTESTPIIHSTSFVLIDKTATVRGYYNTNEEGFMDRLLLDIQLLLGER